MDRLNLFALANPAEAACKPITHSISPGEVPISMWALTAGNVLASLWLLLKVWNWNCQQRRALSKALQASTPSGSCSISMRARLFLPDLQAAASSTPVTIYSVNPSHRPSMQFETAPHSCLLLICKASLRLFSTSKSFKGIYHTLVTIFCINTYIKKCMCIHTYVCIIHTYTHKKIIYIYVCKKMQGIFYSSQTNL